MDTKINNNKKIAIIGLGFRFPGEKNNNQIDLWNSLKNKFDAMVPLNSRFGSSFNLNGEVNSQNAGLISMREWETFDPLFFGIGPKEAPTIDPQQKLLLKCAWECLQDAGIDPLKSRGSNTSVFIGSTNLDYKKSVESRNNVKHNLFNTCAHTLSNRISYCFDLRGASMTVDTACSSSLNAVILGCNSILLGDSDMAMVGGCNFIFDPFFLQSASLMGIIGSEACKVFDSSADGFIRAECVGIVLLKSLNRAIKDNDRIYCVIDGYNSNVDGTINKNNIYSPSKQSQCDNINYALKKSGYDPKEIDYFECHGTGTQVGDPIETEAISMVFKNNRENYLLIGSIKSNIGHAEPASGIASLIKCCLMFKYKQFVPNIHFNNPNPNIKFNDWKLKVVTEVMDFPTNKIIRMGINNFGVTGSNSCLLISQYIKNYKSDQNENKDSNNLYLIPFSANSTNSLNLYIDKILNKIDIISEHLKLEEFVYIQSKLPNLFQKKIFKANNWDDLKNSNNFITNANEDSKSSNILVKSYSEPTIVMVFCGQGPQWIEMGLNLYNSNPLFKNSIDRIDEAFYKYYGFSTFSFFNQINEKDKNLVHIPSICLPPLFMIQVSLFEYYINMGINPKILIGHSFGEYGVLYCSGILSLDDVVKIIYIRSTLLGKTLGMGKMLVVNLGKEVFIKEYENLYPDFEICCFNSPNSIVVSSLDVNRLKYFANDIKSKGIFSTFLPVNTSFHSSSQEILKDDLLEINFNSNEPKIQSFSSVTTNLIEKVNSQYVYNNLRQPVHFEGAIKNIFYHIQEKQMNPNIAFIEISPHPTLLNYVKEMVPKNDYFKIENILFLNSLKKNKNDEELLNSLSKLYYFGVNINFGKQLYGYKINRDLVIEKSNVLPKYQWDDSFYFYERESKKRSRKNGPSIDILGSLVYKTPFKLYKTTIDVSKNRFNFLLGHRIKNNSIVFPGTGYISNILKIFKNNNITISSIDFKQPFFLKSNEPRDLLTSAYQTSANQYKVEFHTNDSIEQYEWQNTTSAHVYINDNGLPKKINIDELISKMNHTTISKKDFYSFIKQMSNLNYTGVFQRNENIYIGSNCVLLKMSIQELENSDDNLFFNISILDCCIHGIIFLNDIQTQLVGKSCGNMRFYSSIPKNRNGHEFILVYCKLIDSNINGLVGNITIMLQDGTILCEIERVDIASTSKRKDILKIEYPNDSLFKPFLQKKDSLLQSHTLTNSFLSNKKYELKSINISNMQFYNFFISNLFIKNIKELNCVVDKDYILNNSLEMIRDYLKVDKGNEKIFNFVMETIKNNFSNFNDDIDKIEVFKDLLKKTSKIIVSKIMKTENSEQKKQNEIFKDEDFISYKEHFNNQYTLVEDIISRSLINEIPNENFQIRVIEFGCGNGYLSKRVLNDIDNINKNNLEIEYTLSDISNEILNDLKNEFNPNNISLLFKQIDLQSSLNSQNLKPNYYDLVIISNVFHLLNNIKFSITEIHNILKPNGRLIFIEPQPSIINDCIFGSFDQWWSFKDNRRNSCLNKEEWSETLKECGFVDNCFNEIYNEIDLIVCVSRKKMLFDNISKKKYSKTIIFGKMNESNNSNLFISNANNYFENIVLINTIDEFKKISMDDNSIIFNIVALENLQINQFKQEILNYISINKYLVDNQLKTKCILLTLNTKDSSEYYLNSSLNGAMKYFTEYTEQMIYSIDLDYESLVSGNLSHHIDILINEKQHTEREYVIRKNIAYIEKYKKIKNLKHTMKNSSIEIENLNLVLNSELKYELNQSQEIRDPNTVKIEVYANGLSINDYYTYKGIIPNNFTIENESKRYSYGSEFSGVVIKVGENVKGFNIGDKVYGISKNSSSSHIIVDYRMCDIIPDNVSIIEASALPLNFIQIYYNLFYYDYLEINEMNILLNCNEMDVVIFTLNLLKYKNFNSQLFITINSTEKEDYLIQLYGDFITGIYSNLDSKHISEISENLKEKCPDKKGIDIIINTQLNVNLEEYFNLLNQNGKFIDLSLSDNQVVDLGKFKNISFVSSNWTQIPKEIIKKLLKKCSSIYSKNSINFVPYIENSINEIGRVIKNFNTNDRIDSFGKFIINHEEMSQERNNLLKKLKLENNLNSKLIKLNYELDENKLGKSVLITGQTGISYEIIRWICKYSNKVENIIIFSISNLKWELEKFIKKIELSKPQIKIIYKSIDVSDFNLLNETLNTIFLQLNIKSIESIFHYANVYIYNELDEINLKQIELSHNAKTIGAINLHKLSLNWNVKNFVIPSSMSSVIGSKLQCLYMSANQVLDSLSKYRNSIGLPCICFNYGPIGSTGIILRNESIMKNLEGSGFKETPLNQLLGSLDLSLENQSEFVNMALFEFNKETVFSIPNKSLLDKFDFILNQIETQINKKQIKTNYSNKSFKDQILLKISELLSINVELINEDITLTEYGVDSLIIVNLKNWLNSNFIQSTNSNSIKDLFTNSQLQDLKINNIIDKIAKINKITNNK